MSFPSGSRYAGATTVKVDVTGTEDVTVWTGRTTPTAGAVPLIYCHGFLGTGTDSANLEEAKSADDFRPICAWGHPVIAGDVGGASTWGNTASITAIDALIAWAASNLGTSTTRVALGAESMGALTALGWAWRNPTKVAAIWLRVPCLGLQWTHDNTVFESAIDTAYSNHAGYLAALDDHDPQRNTTVLRTLRRRIRAWATAADELFPLAVQKQFAGAMGVTLDVIGGDHAAGYGTPPFVVADWLARTIRTL